MSMLVKSIIEGVDMCAPHVKEVFIFWTNAKYLGVSLEKEKIKKPGDG